MLKRRLPILLSAAVLAGCAARPAVTQKAVSPLPAVATKPTDPKANLPLSDIQPAITLPKPATQPTEKPSLEAIELYARARDEYLQNRRFTAINNLEKAIAVDPTSPELRQSLGRAYLGSQQFSDASIAALEKAVELQPDDLDVQLLLGRQYLAKNDLPKAMTALRRAMLTTDYGKGDDQAALTDFFLASAFQRSGFDLAAIDRYQNLLDHTRSPGPNMRGNPELNYLISRPDSIYLEIAGLQEKNGQYASALDNYKAAAERNGDNYELQERIVRMMIALRQPQARDRAAALVRQFNARLDAIILLRDAYRAGGNEAGAVDILRKMLAEQPTNRSVLFALTGALQQMGRATEARDLLLQTTRASKFPVDMVAKLQRLYEVERAWQKSVLLLIEASHQRPDLVSRFASLWTRQMRYTSRQRVRLSDLQALQVPASQQGAKQFWIAAMSEVLGRDTLAKSALQQSIDAQPPFVPAYRMALMAALADDDQPAIKSVLDRAAAVPALSAELNGIALLSQKNDAQAEQAFRRAIELGAHSPNLQDALVDALLRQNQDDKVEKLLLEIINQWPDFEPAYLQLIGFYSSRGKDNQTAKTIETWLTSDPSSVTARLFQARFLIETRNPDAAENVFNLLMVEHSDDPEVLGSLQSLYAQQGRLDVLAVKLSAIFAKQPENRDLLDSLVNVQLAAHRVNDAARLVDAARITFANDADGLYFVSGLYQRLDQKQSAEDTLNAALSVDPKHPGASNDLGYNWVDAGKNLDKAEALVRNAVAAEPDNSAYLDSLGWVLYKRGQFAEAVTYLLRAAEGSRPDPVVLDHLGDALYRANRKDDALTHWTRACERLEKVGTTRDDLKQLKLQLNAKMKQAKEGSPVNVAPVIQTPASQNQAKGTGREQG